MFHPWMKVVWVKLIRESITVRSLSIRTRTMSFWTQSRNEIGQKSFTLLGPRLLGSRMMKDYENLWSKSVVLWNSWNNPIISSRKRFQKGWANRKGNPSGPRVLSPSTSIKALWIPSSSKGISKVAASNWVILGRTTNLLDMWTLLPLLHLS